LFFVLKNIFYIIIFSWRAEVFDRLEKSFTSDFKISHPIFHLFFTAFFVHKRFPQLCSSSFWLCIFWQKDIGKKTAHKMLLELTPGGEREGLSHYSLLKTL